MTAADTRTPARGWLLGRLATFSMAHPDLHIRLAASVWAHEPLDPNVELDIRLASGPISGLTTHQLTHDELFPACSPQLLRQPKRLEQPADLAQHTLLLAIGFAQGWPHGLAAASVRRQPKPADIEFDSMLLAAEMAAAGHGVALVRTSYARDFMDSGRLVSLFDVRLATRDNVFLAHARGLDAASPGAQFRDWLLANL